MIALKGKELFFAIVETEDGLGVKFNRMELLASIYRLPPETEEAIRKGPSPVMADGTLADPEKYGVISIDVKTA